MSDPRKDEDGVVDAGAEAIEDIAEEFLGGDADKDPTPGPPATIKE